MPNITKSAMLCACILGLQACGGGSDPIAESPNAGDGLTQDEVTFYTSVITDLYTDSEKSLTYVDKIEGLISKLDDVESVPAAGSFDMNGAFVIPGVGDNEEDSLVGLVDISVLLDIGTFGGSVRDFVQVNSSSVDPVDTFTGELSFDGTATTVTISGTAVGTLVNEAQESVSLDFAMSGIFTEAEDGSIAVVASGEDADQGLNAEFIGVEY